MNRAAAHSSRFAFAALLTLLSVAPLVRSTQAAGTWTATGSLNAVREGQTATLLANGTVLVAGGVDSHFSPLASAELYNPASGTWSATGSMSTVREAHTATLLASGKVLVAAGDNATGLLATAELYDPASGTWSATGSLNAVRERVLATSARKHPFRAAGPCQTSGAFVPS